MSTPGSDGMIVVEVSLATDLASGAISVADDQNGRVATLTPVSTTYFVGQIPAARGDPLVFYYIDGSESSLAQSAHVP